ncbi:histidine kinase [Flavobacterium sp.]|uniref:sensor histidine kinase n=1 Tax=Flavobacterium sp. TaxID=239 RepID=UPI0026327189|nr:histidine kinase [Flavobacterium sp.]MDG2433884.1 histidine kinase [Flavobacterium sp.]
MRINQFNEQEIVTIILYTSLFFTIIAIGVIVFFYFSRKKIVQKELEKRDLEIKHQKQQLRAILITQEAERQRIAQDLHDDISSKLNIVSLNTHLLTRAGLSENDIMEVTTNIINMTDKALQSTRRIAHDLLPPVLDKFGLHAGIQELCSEFNSSKAVEVVYANTINFEELGKDKSLHLFRILQELINNSIRHGSAKNISIAFDEATGNRLCIYSDDGRGFDMNNSDNQNGLGMKNIQSRVDFLEGTIVIQSKLGGGINVNLSF